MKKIIVLALFIGLLCTSVFAATSEVVSGDSIKNAQTRIDQIGFRLLNYNGIEKRTVFDYDIKSVKNAYVRTTDRQVVLYRGLYNRLESDDEIASILAGVVIILVSSGIIIVKKKSKANREYFEE